MEEWRDIKGYEGLYKISNIGRVKSYQTFGNNQKIGREHFITPTLTTNGYYRIDLIKDNQRKTHRIHRLVAFAFLPNPENKPYINHIEKGRKKPSLEMLISIAVALDVSIDVLLHGNQVSQQFSCSLEINDLLADCDVYEQRVLIQTLRALKQILKDERVLLDRNAHRGF